MSGKIQARSLYRPFQPDFEHLLDGYAEHRGSTSTLLGEQVQFYGFYMKDANMERLSVLPDGCLHLVVCCHPASPSANLCGNLMSGKPGTFVRSNCEYFVVRFLPGYAGSFFGPTMSELVEKEIPIRDMIPRAGELLERIASCTGLTERIAEFERFCLDQYRAIPQSPLLIDYLTGRMLGDDGLPSMEQLSRDTGYSSRHIRNVFERHVGLSPKLFSRIVRFQRAIRLLEQRPEERMLDLVMELGYFDQNHFIKEFKEFSHLTPSLFAKRAATRGTAGEGERAIRA